MDMKKVFKKFYLIFLILFPQFISSKQIVNDDLKQSLEKLYELNPKIKSVSYTHLTLPTTPVV